MKFSPKTGHLVHIQFNLVHDCLRSLCYFRHLANIPDKPTELTYTKDVFAEHVVVTWCKLFGAYREQTHWKRLANSPEAAVAPKMFDTDIILAATGFGREEWRRYHEAMMTARNEFFAHFDFSSMTLSYPRLDPALDSTLAYREWLSSFLNAAIEKGFSATNHALPNDQVMMQFEKEAVRAFGTAQPSPLP